MILNNIGHIICESAFESDKFDVLNEGYKGDPTRPIGVGIMQRANSKNRNGRFYEDTQLFPQITSPRIQELLNAGYLRAEMGHPLETSLARQSQIRQDLCCAKFLKLWTEGEFVWGEFTGTNNDFGREFNADLLDGDKPAWSLRALGEIVQDRVKGACVRNLRIITYDCVIYPSHPEAYTQNLLSESADVSNKDKSSLIIESADGTLKNTLSGEPLVTTFDKKDVLDFIQQESANLKYVKDMFDFVYNDITINESGTKVSMRDLETGDILVINIESYIHNEISNALFGYDEC